MKKNLLGALCVCALALPSYSSMAGEFGVGITAGQALDELDRNCFQTFNRSFSLTCEESDDTNSLGINFSYHFNDSYAIEAGYADLGEYETVFRLLNNSSTLTTDISTAYLAAVGTYSLSDNFSFSARLGVRKSDIQSEISNTSVINTFEVEGDDVAFYRGISFNYDLVDNFGLQVRFEDLGLPVLTMGLTARF